MEGIREVIVTRLLPLLTPRAGRELNDRAIEAGREFETKYKTTKSILVGYLIL